MYKVDGNEDLFDLVIVGAGPGGITAAIYAARANIKVRVVEGSAPGGKMLKTGFVENYPGVSKTTGPDLGIAMFNQLNDLKVPVTYSAVTKIEKNQEYFLTYLQNGQTLISKTVIVATGTNERPMGLANEQNYLNKGISYCAICDGSLYKDKPVAIIGGGNGAVEEGMYLAGIASKVYVVHRRDEFRADVFAVNQLKKMKNVEMCLSYVPHELQGSNHVEALVIRSVKDNSLRTLQVNCVFPYIGAIPATGFLSGLDVLSPEGFIVTNQDAATKVPGLYGVGDCVVKKYRQISTAVSDGTIAALNVKEHLNRTC
ncbi:NAD(P)/FAD-dependent oxidoreductase [[Mycoplasma] testudinis]|uniref:NAD(P)/FAD-dependent oxidoreductase n=1 Tax=[Mycoplasma] testudinis TaxID=33924 RepID=UPI000484AFEF|nr:FAD-dependent oxidoreductase [[Mycoplasma] testudinis]